MKEKEFERIFKALANRRRLAIVRYLKAGGEATVGDIAHTIRLSFTSTSKHLKVLSSAGVLDSDQRKLEVYYRIAKDAPGFVSNILRLL